MHYLKLSVVALVLGLILLIPEQPSEAVERKQKILVLHSYHQGLEWTDNVTRGIQDVFSAYSDQYELHYDYLDTKRNTGEHYQQQLLKFYLAKNQSFKFEAIIVSDNNALNFAMKHRNSIFANIPIIFSGINHFSPEMIGNASDITGIAEYTDYRSTLTLIRKLHPDRKSVLIVLDRTNTGDAIYQDLKAIEPEFKEQLEFNYYRDFDLNDLVGKVASLGNQDSIYLLTANQDRNKEFISFNEAIELISKNSSAPIYGSWDFYFGKGIIGGAITSGEQQGEEAAKLALRVLNGESASSIKPITYSPISTMIDYRYLQRYNIDQSLIPAGARVFNKPAGFYQAYKTYIWYAIAGLALIAILIGRYFYIQREQLHAQQQLNEELDRRVKEKTASLERANKELEWLSHSDGLTQLYNRGFFDKQLKDEWSRLSRVAMPLSLLICDIDFFKNYNDSYGHLAGDDCIKKVAEAIRSVCRRSYDFPARYGGEEFALLLPQTDQQSAEQLAHRLRAAVEQLNIVHNGSTVKDTVSVSIGVSTLIPDQETSPTELIRQADQALYSSKEQGRDQVQVYKG